MAQPGYSSVPVTGVSPDTLASAASISWTKRLAEAVNSLLRGKLNAALEITLAANLGTTTVIDARIAAYSVLLFEPLTTNAAAALYGVPFVLVSSQQGGQVVLAHVNDANTDKTFRMLIIG